MVPENNREKWKKWAIIIQFTVHTHPLTNNLIGPRQYSKSVANVLVGLSVRSENSTVSFWLGAQRQQGPNRFVIQFVECNHTTQRCLKS